MLLLFDSIDALEEQCTVEVTLCSAAFPHARLFFWDDDIVLMRFAPSKLLVASVIAVD